MQVMYGFFYKRGTERCRAGAVVDRCEALVSSALWRAIKARASSVLQRGLRHR